MRRFTALALAATLLLTASGAQAARTLKPVSAYRLGLSACVVDSVYSGSPADKAGLLRGDTLVSLQGTALIPEFFAPALRELPSSRPATFVLGRSSGRSTVEFTPRAEPPRLGIEWFPSGTITDAAATLRDHDLWIGAAVQEWSSCTFLRVDISNLSQSPISIAPDSFYVVDGDNQLCRTISADEFLTLKYGGKISSVAGNIPHSIGEGIVQGAVEGWTEGSRAAVTRNILANAMKPVTIPANLRSGGALIVATEHILGPIQLHMKLNGVHYVFEFEGGGKPRRR